MLQFIRSRVTSIFVKILFGLLIASFAIWGIGDIFLGNRGGQAAIKVGDIAYNSAEVLDQFERVRRRLGLQITAQQAAELGLLDNVIKELVNEGLFAAEGQSLGLAVGDAVIKGRIASNQAFQGPGGAFDPATFRQVLFNAGLSEAAFVDVLRKDVARSQIVEAVSTGSAPAKP
ncbi:MAG: SurA N-terminal domain-containing protein, partial [Rhodospirillaceae bacterium]|nr:SurA N-terminal domain-containing protein [Rhodospirillaceae bacterium]